MRNLTKSANGYEETFATLGRDGHDTYDLATAEDGHEFISLRTTVCTDVSHPATACGPKAKQVTKMFLVRPNCLPFSLAGHYYVITPIGFAGKAFQERHETGQNGASPHMRL